MKIAQVYTIITDLPALQNFIEWLPELAPHEKFFLCLFARKKYCPGVLWIKSDKGELGRFLSDKQRMLSKIRQLEVIEGAYQFSGKAVPQESLALYITPNPRDTWKAIIQSIKALATVIQVNDKASNAHQVVMSEIHRSCRNRPFIDFDIDTKDSATLSKAVGLVDEKCSIIETRGGFHVLVSTAAAKAGFSDRMWYKKLEALSDVSAGPHSMVPVPGTYQGGFTPVLYKTVEDARLAGALGPH